MFSFECLIFNFNDCPPPFFKKKRNELHFLRSKKKLKKKIHEEWEAL